MVIDSNNLWIHGIFEMGLQLRIFSLQPDLWIGTISDNFQLSRNVPDDNDLLKIKKRGNEMFIAQLLRKQVKKQ